MDDIPLLARHAMEDTCTPSNPVDAVEGEVARIIAKTYCEGLVVEAVRQQGFGAGMGLPNMKKNADTLEIDTVVGVGTTVTAVVRL